MLLSVSILTHEVINSPTSSKLVDPSVGHFIGEKITTSKPFFELRLGCRDIIQPKTGLTYKFVLFRSPWHLENEFL